MKKTRQQKPPKAKPAKTRRPREDNSMLLIADAILGTALDVVAPETPVVPKTKKPEPLVVEVPSVWKDDGYMILVHDEDEHRTRGGDTVKSLRWLSTRTGEAHQCSREAFVVKVSRAAPEINPIHLALNLLLRSRSGLMPLRVRDERKLVSMLTKEELLKLSERELARSWSSIMGVKGPERIKGAAREKAIDEMIAKATADAAKAAEEPGPNGDKKPKREKKVKEPKPPKAPKPVKEKKVKEPRPPKPPKVKKERKAKLDISKVKPGENPFRTGSMKFDAFAYYSDQKASVTDADKLREKCIAQMQKAGAAEATSKSWYAVFLKVGK